MLSQADASLRWCHCWIGSNVGIEERQRGSAARRDVRKRLLKAFRWQGNDIAENRLQNRLSSKPFEESAVTPNAGLINNIENKAVMTKCLHILFGSLN